MGQRTCGAPECDRRAIYTDPRACPMHYQRWKNHGSFDLPTRSPNGRPKRVGVEPCSIAGCVTVVKARGWCAKHWSRWHRFGSPTHRVAGEVVDGKKVCYVCGLDKPTGEYHKAGRSTYCKPCEAEKQREYLRVNPRPRKAPNARQCVCEICAKPFMGDNRQYLRCSPGCRRIGANRANIKFVQHRRAKERDPAADKFAPRVVYERDEWTCGLCGSSIDPAHRAPSPDAPSIDHIVPLSRGGTHTLANVQAAHLGCNVRKGNRIAV